MWYSYITYRTWVLVWQLGKYRMSMFIWALALPLTHPPYVLPDQ